MINFSDYSNLDKLISLEIDSLSSTLNIQKILNKQILVFFKDFFGNIEIIPSTTSNDSSLKYITKATTTLNESNSNIEAINTLISMLFKIKDFKKNNPTNKVVLQKNISEYNTQFSNSINQIHHNTIDIENFIHDITLLDTNELLNEINIANKSANISSFSSDSDSSLIDSIVVDSSFVENTLIISDSKKKVFLPYKINDLKNILLQNKEIYSSIQDIIDTKYVKPFSYYRFSAIARFREAFKLVAERQHGSKKQAFSLAFELFFNYNLHPAIITACKTQDELDVYLACLEDNSFEDFHYFDIKFEIPPSVNVYNSDIYKEPQI